MLTTASMGNRLLWRCLGSLLLAGDWCLHTRLAMLPYSPWGGIAQLRHSSGENARRETFVFRHMPNA